MFLLEREVFRRCVGEEISRRRDRLIAWRGFVELFRMSSVGDFKILSE